MLKHHITITIREIIAIFDIIAINVVKELAHNLNSLILFIDKCLLCVTTGWTTGHTKQATQSVIERTKA